jgi:hypothetical protein
LLPKKSKFQDYSGRLIMGMQLDFALQDHKFMNRKDIIRLLNKGFSKADFKHLGGNVYLVSATKI